MCASGVPSMAAPTRLSSLVKVQASGLNPSGAVKPRETPGSLGKG